ncbi:MAG: hypothetical protein AAF483_09265 [Planctomycetota bacterium]
MFQFLSRYLKSLGSLLVALILYALVVVPIVEPQDRQPTKSKIFSPSLPTDYWWQGFFPEGSWQTENPKIINTSRGILLAKEWDEVDETTISFKPITMIMPQTQAGRDAIERNELGAVTRQDMWIVSAEEGATIHFEEAFSNFGGSVPKIKRGELSGAIEVSRQVASEVEDKPWRLRTRDLSINQTQLTTRNEVLIEWGDSVVQGRDLLIRLRSDLLGSEGTASPAWGPLDELELYQVQKVDVSLPPGGLWANLDPNQLQSNTQAGLAALPARLRASCGGRFSFDFKNSTATLRNGVQVHHFLGNLKPDQFTCERISIFLDPPSKDRRTAPSEVGSAKEATLGGIGLKGFVAIGADSLENFVSEKSVWIDAPTIGLNVKCKRLEVDLEAQKVKFAGKLESPESTQSAVVLQYQGNEFRSPNIEYKAPPRKQGSPATTTESNAASSHLGWLVAAGPGEFRTHGDSLTGSDVSIGQTHVRWQGVLKMAPAPDGVGAQWIEIAGNTLIETADQGYVTSDRFEVWLEKYSPREEVNANGSGLAASNLSSRLRPLRVFSAEPTELTTPDIHAVVQELDLKVAYYEEQELASLDPEGLALSDSEGNPMYQWVKPPPENNIAKGMPGPHIEGEKQQEDQNEPRIPIQLNGSVLKATIARQGKQNWIPKLDLRGPVRIGQTPPAETKQLPWEILGKTLLLATNPAGEADLQVAGAPAEMKWADGGVLKGNSIRFSQMHGVIFMDHPGEFTLPKSLLAHGGSSASQSSDALLPSSTDTTLEQAKDGGPSIEWLRAPHCTWQGRMYFDGSVVHIEKDVVFDAALRNSLESLWLTKGRANKMEIHLTQPIDLKKGQEQDVPAVDMDRLILSGQVEILASQVTPTGEMRSREEIHVPTMTFYLNQQELVANGPGWIHSRFLSKRKLGQLASDATTEKLQGAYLTFRDSMVALMEQKKVTLEGRVELLASPLSDWDDSAIPAANHQLTQDQMLLNCDQLKVYDTADLSMHQQGHTATVNLSKEDTWEFRATGDVAFNGNGEKGHYLGNGYQLTYSRSKNLMMLRGDGRKPGYLQSVPKNSEDGRFKAYVESVALNPETLSILDLKLGQGGFQMESGNTSNGQPSGNFSNPSPTNNFSPSQNIDPRGVDFYRSGR